MTMINDDYFAGKRPLQEYYRYGFTVRGNDENLLQ